MIHFILEKSQPQGHYYIDFDKTLAHHRTDWGVDKIGKPIPKMLERVKRLIAQGNKVKIFTARVAHGPKVVKDIQDWLEENGLPRLDVTNIKGTDVIEIWDDRARQVIPNKGEIK